MLRMQTALLGFALLALAAAIILMVAGAIPAERSSVLGALIAAEPTAATSAPAPTVTPIDSPVSFDGLRPGQTETFGLREGLVIVNAIYDGTVEPFTASLRSHDDPQADSIASITIIPPLDRQGAATAQITSSGSYVVNVERAEGEWAVTIAQPGDAGGAG